MSLNNINQMTSVNLIALSLNIVQNYKQKRILERCGKKRSPIGIKDIDRNQRGPF